MSGDEQRGHCNPTGHRLGCAHPTAERCHHHCGPVARTGLVLEHTAGAVGCDRVWWLAWQHQVMDDDVDRLMDESSRDRRRATAEESRRHERVLRALAVANLRAFTTDRPLDELAMLDHEIDTIVAELLERPGLLDGFIEEVAVLVSSLYVQLATTTGLTARDAIHLARTPLDPD